MIAEQKLVTQMLLGDSDTEEAFYRMYKPRLLRAATYFLGWQDSSEAEDIVQETFLVALRKIHVYDFKAPLFPWLRQICLRLCYVRLRARGRVLVSLSEDMELFTRRTSAERIQTMDLQARTQKRLDLVEELKKSLSADAKVIVELRDVQGMRYAAISRVLDIPIGTVMSRLARARDHLKRLVENLPENGRNKVSGPLPLHKWQKREKD